MVRIVELKITGDQRIKFSFSDGVEKEIDFAPFIGSDKMSQPLSDPDYFAKVKTYDNGRGIFWPNEYDFCPDYLRQYEPTKKAEFA